MIRPKVAVTHPRPGCVLLSAALALVGASCTVRPSVLLPERPPAPLDRPLGIDDDTTRSRPSEGPPAPPIGAPIGGAEPSQVLAAARDGQWVALCRCAGSEDDPQCSPALAVGAEPALAVERFVAFDPTGRHVAYVQEDELMLLDTEQGTQARLRGLDASERTFALPLPVAFDAAGERVAYLARTDDGPRIRVRSLTDRAERELDPGPGQPLAVHLETDGSVRIEMQVTKGEPEQERSFGAEEIPLSCRRPAWRAVGAGETRHAHIDGGGLARTVRGAIGAWSDGILVRTDDGALVLRRSRDESVVVVDAQCRGQVLHRDTRRARLLVACGATDPPSVRIYSAPAASGDVAEPSSDAFETLGVFEADPLVADGPGWVDAEQGRVLLADPPRMLDVEGVEELLYATGRHALVRRTADYAVIELDTGESRALDQIDPMSSEVLHAGAMVAIVIANGGWVVDLAQGRVHGRTHHEPLAITRSGHVLVAADVGAPRLGPFMWIDPSR
jgi:hypothetical protein